MKPPFSWNPLRWTDKQFTTAVIVVLLLIVPLFSIPVAFLSGQSMQSEARKAVSLPASDKTFESTPGYCSRFVRQVSKAEYDLKYAELFGASAIETCNRFLADGRAWRTKDVDQHGGLQPGDILFKRDTSGKWGHVGIYVGGNLVAENSSTKIGRVHGAKGYRSIAQFGNYDFVGRLPGNNSPRLILALVKANRSLYIEISGAEFDSKLGSWIVDRDVVADALDEKADDGRLPLRKALASLSFDVAKTGDHRKSDDPRFYVFLKAA